MTGDDDFLRAILEDPADDGLRLVFADWLDERGDWRGAVLRLACAVRRLPAEDPQRLLVETSLRKLLRAVDRTWGMPVAVPAEPGRGPREYTGLVRPTRTEMDWSRL